MKKLKQETYIKKLQEGDEKGLNYFYQHWYKHYYWISWRRTACDLSSAAMVQEAFLRLWMVRESIQSVEQAQAFMRKQLKLAYQSWYQHSGQRFHRNLLRLDGMEGAYDFISPVKVSEKIDADMDSAQEAQKQEQLKMLYKLLPNLPESQQKVVKLLLNYGLDYERIAWHLGGVSCYVAAQRIEQTLKLLKSILVNGAQLSGDRSTKKEVVIIGGLNEEQARILRYRYELSYSFEEIAKLMNVRQTEVQLWFVQAHQMMRKERSA